MIRCLTGRLAVRLMLACGALAVNACSHADGADATPRLHVMRVDDPRPEALAGAREYARSMVESCRAATHLAGAAAPLSDARLARIVYYQDEAFYDGDRIAHYTTRRFVVADAASSCKPYVLVSRQVTIADGCATRVTGRSGGDIASGGADASAGAPEVHVESTGATGDACVHKRKPVDATKLPAQDAGSGARCVWRSRLLAARFSALAKSGADAGDGPAAHGLDACLYQALPHYASAHSAGEDVVLRTHVGESGAGARSARLAVSGGHAAFEGDTRLQSFESGGPAMARFDKAAAEAFVHLPAKEDL